MIRNLKNETDSAIVLTDLKGITVEAGEVTDGLAFGLEALRLSVSVLENLLSGNLSVNDGAVTYTGGKAVDLIKGTQDQLTRDGKKIITTSDRPQDHFRHFTGRGDDMVGGIRGEGPELTWVVNPEEDPEHVDVQFLDDVYLKDGHIKYVDAALGSWLTVETYAPAGVPFPVPGNGNFDYTNGAWVPNAGNTGMYRIAATETLVNRFINKLPLLGDGEREALSAEPVLIPTPYLTRFKVHSESDAAPMSLILTLGLYRKRTF